MKKKALDSMASTRLSVYIQSVSYSLVMMALFGGIGYWIDSGVGSQPAGTIIGIVISYPLTQYLLYKKITKK